jgi:glyoxylase-like metal-dependent hydrolase (beta-lactamase superfamily II)
LEARNFKVGDVKIAVLNVGDFAMSLYDIFGKDADLTRYFDLRDLATPPFYPSNTMLVETDGNRVLVDPGDRERLLSAYGEQPPDAPPAPPSLFEQLATAGAKPSEIGTVVVTHLHYDHFAGLTHKVGEENVPSFPKATHIIPKRDWDMAEILEARKKGDKDLVETLGVVEKAGLLSCLDGPMDLGGGVTISPSPGESPGHQIVGVTSRGEACYCVGDLYHLKEEVEHPELAATWADAEVLARSRKAFAGRAARESAVVLPGHMRPGRISIKGGAPVWSEV